MEIDQLRQEINDLLENIVEHSNNYSDNRPLPSLEVSYVLSKVNKMQEAFTILKFLLEQQELANKTSSRKAVKFPKIEGEEDDWNDEPEQDELSEVSPEVAAGQEEQMIEEIGATIHNEGNETIEEETKEEEAPQLISNIEALPISKIVDALTLNDRYLYANELFEKDMSAFNELIKVIDNSSSIEEAKTIISEYGEDWDADNEHVISFISIVERRFM